jgi:hypothetical protein
MNTGVEKKQTEIISMHTILSWKYKFFVEFLNRGRRIKHGDCSYVAKYTIAKTNLQILTSRSMYIWQVVARRTEVMSKSD